MDSVTKEIKLTELKFQEIKDRLVENGLFKSLIESDITDMPAINKHYKFENGDEAILINNIYDEDDLNTSFLYGKITKEITKNFITIEMKNNKGSSEEFYNLDLEDNSEIVRYVVIIISISKDNLLFKFEFKENFYPKSVKSVIFKTIDIIISRFLLAYQVEY